MNEVSISLSRYMEAGKRTLVDNKKGLVGFILLLLVVVGAVFAPFLTPYKPTEMNVLDKLKGPSV
ncbi:hypothetical protein K9M06_04950, partial [Candidatus Bipolaricaulota bacterium]|nr:hypothetical protein [Candidatus Bipolaricaulota bacterium]